MDSRWKARTRSILQTLIMWSSSRTRKRIKIRRTLSSSFLLGFGVISLQIFLVKSLILQNSESQGRSLIGPGGVILDIPKIRVLRYKVRSSDPFVVSDELDCDGGECGDIIEPPQNKLHLGTTSAKELNEWSLPQNVTKLVVECKSRSGVVQWEYEGNGVMHDVEIENVRHVGDFWSASTYLHVSTLTFNRISDQLTGKYTCKNVDKSMKSNSFYLFVPQPKSEVINDGRRIEVVPPSHADEVVIPCRMEKRQTPIHLFRKSPDGVYRKMMLHGGSRFDPYLGFILPVTPDVFGEYACKVDKKKRKKNKRNAPALEPSIAMLPPSQSSPSDSTSQKSSPSSPGFSAFPNSEELAEIVKTEEDAILLASLLASASGEHPATVPPEKAVPPIPTQATPNTVVPTRITIVSSQPFLNTSLPEVPEVAVASFTPYKRNKMHRRRKRPFMTRRRHGAATSATVTTNANVVQRRQGLPPYPLPHYGGHVPMAMPPRTPFLKNRRPVFPHRPPMSPILVNPSQLPLETSGSGSAILPTSSGSLSLPVVLNQPFHRSHYYGHQHAPSHHLHHPPQSPPHGLGLSHSRLPDLVEEKLPIPGSGSQELFSGIGEAFLSRIDGSKYPSKTTTKKPISLFPQNLLPPTMTVVHTMQCVLKKMVLGADVPCNASLTDGIQLAERHGNTPKPSFALNSIAEPQSNSFVKEQKTILEVAIMPPPENKFFPANSKIFTTTPFFVKWETRFTDYANWAQVNHSGLKEGHFKRHRAESVADFENGVNALEIFDLPEGETGNITVTYMGGRKEIRTHTWHYLIINQTTASQVGLKQTVDGVVKVFMCRSATSKRPLLSLARLTENGCPEDPNSKDPFSGSQDYTEEDCGLGCSLLRTKIDQGVVTCRGDGVIQSLIFPEDVQCTGRPYFIDRGKQKNLTLEAKGNRLLIPCVINNPNADVYLFHQLPSKDGGGFVEVTDNSTYDLKAGFYLDTKHIDDPYGVYLCTSTPDTDDESDMVTYHVVPMEESKFYPPHGTVYGQPPFKFMWESKEKYEVDIDKSISIGKFEEGVFAKSPSNSEGRPYDHVGTFETFSNVTRGMVRVLRKSDRKVVHTWRFEAMSRVGLSLDKERNLFRCQAQTDNQPMLYAVPCDNPNECKMERKHFDEDEDEDIKSGRENSHCGDGCVQLKIWRNKPLGFVRCKGDGVDETLQYFLTENSTIVTEEDEDAIRRLKQPEILNGVRRLRVGETADFICKGNRYFYSKGFQWAIETKNGQKKFIDAKVREDVLLKDEVRSVINLKILDAEWKRVWCYTPELTTNQWANVSQPIYLR